MELLIFWGIPVIVALIGLQRMFYRMFAVFVCTAFAAYLGIWNAGWLSTLVGFLPESIRYAVAIAAGGVIAGGILIVLFQSLNPRRRYYTFPAIVDRTGGALLGFLSGLILVSFLGLTISLTPFRAELPLGINPESVQARSQSGVMTLTKTVNAFTLQSRNNTHCRERLDGFFAAAAPQANAEQTGEGGTL